MTTKEDYRYYFLSVKEYVKLGKIASECNIQPSRLSAFISKLDNDVLSFQKLEMLVEACKDVTYSVTHIDEL